MLNNFYTIGSDPELFLFNTKTGKIVSAIDKIPGYKFCPYTEGLPEGFGLQTDNILAEFNIPPVIGTEEKYVKEAFDTNWLSTVGENINEFESFIPSPFISPHSS